MAIQDEKQTPFPEMEMPFPEKQMPLPESQEPVPDPSSCFMCQMHEALKADEPDTMPRPIMTIAQAESAMTSMLCCGTSTYVAWRYRRTRVVRRFFFWLMGAYLLLLLAFVFFIATVYLM